jgi:hypothetical protein
MRRLILALCLLAFSNCWAGIGTVTDHKGDACSIQRGKDKMSGLKGAGVESNDTYVTGNCVSNITFKDDTKVKVTENSRLLIDDFVFDPKASDAGKLALKVGMGTVRYASGQIAKNNPQKVDIKTPTASIAVRGTDFTMTVDEAGQSLVMLLPSCKDEKEVKKYELEENRCKVGKIEVSTAVGTVSLDKAFEATFITSANLMPTPPVVVNTIESKIGNNLIIVKPTEIQQAIREQGKSRQDKEQEELEAEAQRRLTQMVKDSTPTEHVQLLATTYADGKAGCNPRTSVCVSWERNDASDIQSKGKGIAYRITDGEHYAEVKTLGYSSNTFVSITHDDNYASTIIGDGSPGGNVVNIKQNTGVLKVSVK